MIHQIFRPFLKSFIYVALSSRDNLKGALYEMWHLRSTCESSLTWPTDMAHSFGQKTNTFVFLLILGKQKPNREWQFTPTATTCTLTQNIMKNLKFHCQPPTPPLPHYNIPKRVREPQTPIPSHPIHLKQSAMPGMSSGFSMPAAWPFLPFHLPNLLHTQAMCNCHILYYSTPSNMQIEIGNTDTLCMELELINGLKSLKYKTNCLSVSRKVSLWPIFSSDLF